MLLAGALLAGKLAVRNGQLSSPALASATLSVLCLAIVTVYEVARRWCGC